MRRLSLFGLAWRNTLRNPRRTLLALVAFAVGVAALVCAWSVFDGSNAQMIGNMTSHYTGYIQVHRQGYADDPAVDRAFESRDVAGARIADLPGVEAVSPRMESMSLISSAGNSRGVIVVGVDPQREPTVTSLHQKISAGRYFEPDQTGGILIGQSLARVLGVGIGGEVALLTQGMQGSIGAQRYRVQGLYDTGNDMVDGMQAFITRADADVLLSSGQRMTTLAVRLKDRDSTDAVVREIRSRLSGQFEVEGWQQLLPEVAQSVDFHEAVGKAITLLLFGIVAIGLANTVLMSVSERVREFGVMMALGTAPRQIFRIIIYEGLILGLMGSCMGFCLGYALVAYFGSVGLQLDGQADAVQMMQGVSRTIYPHLSVDRMLYLAGAVLLVMVVGSLYPAWKIARMLPLLAMHGVAGSDTGAARHPAASGGFARHCLLPALALRNLSRHPMRTWLTLFAITFGLGAFVFAGSIANGFYTQIVENATGMVTGDAQIQLRGFKDDMKPTLALPDGLPLLDRVRAVPAVAGATARVQTSAMISSPAKSLPIMFIGVDPEHEREVTFLDRSVREGRYLQAGNEREIVIGKRLAELLRVRLGERVVLMAQDVQGNLASESFVVAGLFHTGSHSFDDVMAHVSLPVLQRMLGMGDAVTNIALRMQAAEAGPAAGLPQVEALLPPGELRLLRWQELVPAAARMNVIFRNSLTILLAIVLLMVSVVIMNTVLMSVLERTREFGTMLALGSRPGLIVLLVQLESALIACAGTLGGLLFGMLLVLMHSARGVDMKMHAAAIPGVTNIIFPKLSPMVLAVPGVLLPLLALLAAVYPAWRAARLDPVRALRHV